ncbi:MAG TPA: cytochrome c-type biogenesis protein [Salinisphaeraceae bacterium]|nr:cytochrome c-type biogenesis protein [Salinisphaeraceae bacterium]
MRVLLISLLLALATAVGAAGTAMQEFDDPALRARYQALTAQLRCVVCLNSNIAESGAPLAEDMRHLVAARIRAGYSDAEIKDILVERYGTFVLYDPPFSMATWLLWLGPAALLLVGLSIALMVIYRNRRTVAEPAVRVDHERVARLLEESDSAEEHRS